MPIFRTYLDKKALALAAAEFISRMMLERISRKGCFSIALAGGSTPRDVYRLMAQAGRIMPETWERVHFFWGDERCVPPDDPVSNNRMVRETLLNHVPVPERNIHPITCHKDPVQSAREYEILLRDLFKSPDMHPEPVNSFDLTLLGMGPDGHTASIFPGSVSLRESHRWVLAEDHNSPPPPLVPRVTLTLPVLNLSRDILILVAGEEKSTALKQVLSCSPDEQELLPVQRIKPIRGKLTWMVVQSSLPQNNK
jgi:6-phosphogluconolactonase